MGRLDACEAIADFLMPDEPTFDVTLPTDKLIEAMEAQHAKKKAK